MPPAAILSGAKFVLLQKDVPARVVNAATATGVGKSIFFTIQEDKDGTKGTATFLVSGTFTVGTVTLLCSTDGGGSTTAYSTADTAAVDVAANKVFSYTDLVP